MAEIELVIKISEEAYEQLIEAGDFDYLEIITAIENGIPFQEKFDRENSEIKNEVKDLSKRVEILEKQMKEVKEPFNTQYPTWIIAFCPDTNSFFVTNERHFFWESEEEFNSENDGINYFEHNISFFIDIANKITHTEKVWLENTSKWYDRTNVGNRKEKATKAFDEIVSAHS